MTAQPRIDVKLQDDPYLDVASGCWVFDVCFEVKSGNGVELLRKQFERRANQWFSRSSKVAVDATLAAFLDQRCNDFVSSAFPDAELETEAAVDPSGRLYDKLWIAGAVASLLLLKLSTGSLF